MAEIESDFDVIKNTDVDLSPLQKETITLMQESIESRHTFLEQMKEDMDLLEIKDIPPEDQYFVAEVTYDFNHDLFVDARMSLFQEAFPEATDFEFSLIKLSKKITSSFFDIDDVLSVTGRFGFHGPWSRKRREQYQAAVDKIEKGLKEHFLHEERYRKPIITKVENGLIEAYVPIYMTKPNAVIRERNEL